MLKWLLVGWMCTGAGEQQSMPTYGIRGGA